MDVHEGQQLIAVCQLYAFRGITQQKLLCAMQKENDEGQHDQLLRCHHAVAVDGNALPPTRVLKVFAASFQARQVSHEIA